MATPVFCFLQAQTKLEYSRALRNISKLSMAREEMEGEEVTEGSCLGWGSWSKHILKVDCSMGSLSLGGRIGCSHHVFGAVILSLLWNWKRFRNPKRDLSHFAHSTFNHEILV